MNVFEFAAKNRLRFPYKGLISTEDLYSLSVDALDSIYKTLNQAKKRAEEESLLSQKSAEDTRIEVQLAIIKHVFDEKQQQAINRQKAQERAAQKQKILAILAEKDDAELRSKSKDELLKMAEEL